MCYDAPEPPDYAAAAREQGEANKEAGIASSRLNNPNVINPYGTQTWTEGAKETDRPTMVQTFSPEQQELYNKSIQTKGLLGDLGIQGASALGSVIGKNLDMSSLPEAPGDASATRDKVYNAMMSRVTDDINKSRDQANSNLIAAGIRPGTAAYEAAMDRINRQETDARNQAIISSGSEAQRDFQMDSDRRRAALGEMLASRQTPLNEINALMTGSQVNNPFAVPNAAQNTQIAPPPLFDAAKAQYKGMLDAYNAEQAAMGDLMDGLFSIAAAKVSDRRLKSNIKRIGTHQLGIGIYEYDIFGKRDIGVMADEVLSVKPSAVIIHPSGYLMVDYGAL